MRLSRTSGLLVLSAMLSSCGGETATGTATYTVTVGPSTLNIALGSTGQPVATVARLLGTTPLVDNAASVSWTSSNTSVATVNPSGMTSTVTGVGHGTATITATSNGASGATTVVVTAPPCSILTATNPAVTVGTTISGALTPADCRDARAANVDKPADYYKLVLTSIQLVTVDLTSSGFTPDVRLIGPSNNTYETMTGSAPRLQRALNPGNYTIAVGAASGTGGSYSLNVTTAPVTTCSLSATTATATPLPATINGTLASTDCRIAGDSLPPAKLYRFTLSTTQTVNAVLTSAAFAPRVFVNNSDFRFVIGSTPDATSPSTTRFSATTLAPGEYYVIVTGTAATALGAFTLTLSGTAVVPPTIKACSDSSFVSSITATTTGTTVSGSLTTSDCRLADGSYYAKIYRLVVASPAKVQIDMNSTVFDTYLYLFSPGLVVLETNDDISATILDSRITRTLAAGTYYIAANSTANNVTGAYTLSVKIVP